MPMQVAGVGGMEAVGEIGCVLAGIRPSESPAPVDRIASSEGSFDRSEHRRVEHLGINLVEENQFNRIAERRPQGRPRRTYADLRDALLWIERPALVSLIGAERVHLAVIRAVAGVVTQRAAFHHQVDY